MLIKLLVAALIFLALMFIALVWLVAVLANITLWLPAGVTFLFFFTIGAVFAVRALQARKAARGLEDALRSQAKQQALLTRPDLQLEVQRMRDEFEKAVGALKSSRLGKGGHEALYYLPWYTIIGPPGAGKSTALRNSGLRFPYLSDNAGGAVKGVGGTRNCDWWLTNQAVVLDTAGRWATQEEDHDEWLAFLGMVKKHRPKKPLNGLITAISVGDIVNVREDEVDALARRMRERIDEVIGQLDVALPVYVLFTKCDLVEGFVEMFGDLRGGEREQTWGFTAPLAARMEDPAVYFDQRFAELAQVLDARSLGRMSEERSIPRRQRIYAFPQQFMMMRRNLTRFIGILFEQNVYKETPAMRGVYFTSGTQEGRPFSLLLNRLVESMGVKGRLNEGEPPVDQKSYFLHDVFMKVMFEDCDVASASEAELKRQRIKRVAVTCLLTLVALAFGVVPTLAYQQNRLQLSRTEELVKRWEKPSPAEVRPLEKLPEINELTANLVSYSDEAPKWLTTLGMYQGDRVKPHLRRYYANVLRREMVQPIIAHDVQSMTDFGFRYESLPTARPTPDEQAEQYPLLKLHLLLTKPKAPSEPAYGEAEQAWVAQQVAQRWLSLPGKGAAPPPDHVARAQKLAVEYSGFHREYQELAFTRDRDVVIRERAALTRAPFAERALERIVETVDEEGWDLTLDRLIGRTAAIQSTVTVPGAFTRRGWENKVREMIDAGVLDNAGELWVLGLTDGEAGSQAQLQKQLAELSSLYFRGYIDAWQSFLRGLRIDPPSDNTAALTLLRDLTRGQPPPLSLLLQKVHYNVQLKPKEEEKSLEDKVKDGAIDALKNKLGKVLGKEKMAAVNGALAKKEPGSDYLIATDVAKAFEDITGFAVPPDTGDDGPKPSVPYEAYHEQLFYVRDALQMQMDNPEERDQLISKLQAARVRVRSIIDEQPVGYRPTFDQLFWPPVEGASSTSGVAMAGSVGGRWCTEVYAPFESMIRGHYPFDPNGHDLSLDELGRFYGPEEGIVPMFVKDALSRTVELDGDQYSFAKALGENASNLYSPALLEFLERSLEIASVFYPRGAKTPSVDFEVMVHPSPYVATTTMSVGGKKIEYHNGPEKWETLTWPGEKPEAGASFVLRGANGMNERISQDNVWGLFRLIEAGTITRSSSRTFTVAWQLQTHNVTLKVDFRPVRGESPFFGIAGRVQKPVFMQSVRTEGVPAPRAIVASAKPCKG